MNLKIGSVRQDEEPDEEFVLSDSNNKEIICGCTDSYFEMQLNKLYPKYREESIKEFVEFKAMRHKLSEIFSSYCRGDSSIKDLARQFEIIASKNIESCKTD